MKFSYIYVYIYLLNVRTVIELKAVCRASKHFDASPTSPQRDIVGLAFSVLE